MKSRRKLWMLAGLLVALLAVVPTICRAQFNSNVEGTVSDPSGAVVPNAAITLHSVQTGIDLNDNTNGVGFYRFSGVGPGDYVVIVNARGFAKKEIEAHVNQDQDLAVNVLLAVPGASAAITVTAVADQLNFDETRVQTTLESDQVENLPLQNGSILEAVRIAPGVTGIDEDRDLWAVGLNGNTMTASANGRPGHSNSYELDGISMQFNTNGYGDGTTAGGANLAFVPAPDMIQEVALEVNQYSADSGAAASMKISMTTKGGTNNFHGTFGDRYSGRGLNARADFTAPLIPASRRWYTGSFGGPIWKNKTFFFFSYLHQTQETAMSGGIDYLDNSFTQTWAPANYPFNASAPVGKSQGANVHYLLQPFPAGSATGGQIASIYQTGVVAYASNYNSDPHGTPSGWVGPWQPTSTTCAVPTYSGPWFTGSFTGSHSIPCSTPIVDSGNLNQTPRVNGFQIDGRLDQYFREGKDRVYGAYLLQPQVSDFIWWRPNFNATTPGGSRFVNVNYSHIFSQNLISQTGLGYLRTYGAFTGSPSNTVPFLSLILGSPDGATDYFGTPGSPTNSMEHDYSLREDVSWTHNRHNVKAGFNYAEKQHYNNQAGWLSKAEVPLYWGLSDVLDDHPWSYSLDTLSGTTGKWLANIIGAQVKQFGLYGQDEWKVKPNLLLSLGLRWDNFGNPAQYGKNALPFNNAVFPSGQGLRQALINDSVQTATVNNAFSSAEDMNFMPRVGFAWQPLKGRRFTVHGGAGLYEDSMNLAGISSSINSPTYLNTSFGFFNPAPFNILDPRNFYGTNWQAPAPYGMTYAYPAITPVGVDKHGEILSGGTSSNPTGIYQTALTAFDPHLKPQKSALYNLQIEQELMDNLIVGVGYSGSYSWGQYGNGDYNDFPGDEIANSGSQARLSPMCCGSGSSPEWGSVGYLTNLESDNYNGLLLTARQNYHRLSWQASFTWARTLAHVPGQDIYDPAHYYGPTGVPKSFNASAQYELPGRGLHNLVERALLGGWEISGIATAQAGSYFSLVTSNSFQPLNLANAPTAEGGTCKSGCTYYWDPSADGGYLANGQTGSLVNLPAGLKTKGFSRDQWKYGIFSKLGYTFSGHPTYSDTAYATEFTNPTQYGITPVYGNQGYNMFQGPGYLDIDSALHKKILLPWFGKEGGSTLMLGIEGSNVINRVNLQDPSQDSNNGWDLANTSSNVVGVSTSANQARIFQVVGKFEF